MKLYTEIIALCDYAIIANDNKLSIMGIFDEFRAEKFPAGFLDKYLVATINGEPNHPYKLTVELEKDENGHNLLNPTIVNALTSSNGKQHLIIRLTSVGLDQDGDYYFKIYNGNEEIGSTLLKAIQLQKKTETAEVHIVN